MSYDDRHRQAMNKKTSFNLREDIFNIEKLTCDHADFVASVTKRDLESIEYFLTECLKKRTSVELINRQFYVSCFWGFRNIVDSLLKQHTNLNINQANASTLWTPLHAATFRENGPVVLRLLECSADAYAADTKGRTPIDFASASNLIWPLFDTFYHKRVDKKTLAKKGVFSQSQLLNQHHHELLSSSSLGENNNNNSNSKFMTTSKKQEYDLDIKGFESIRFAPYEVISSSSKRKDAAAFNSALYDGDVLAGQNSLNLNEDLLDDDY